MRYPGNASLTGEIQQRILSTFEQTLSAAAAGNRREALLGCDFILRLDPLFEHARELQQRLETGEGAVETADFQAVLAEILGPGATAAAAPAADEPAPAAPADAPDLDGLGELELPPLEAPPTPAEPTAATPAPAVDDLSDLEIEAEPANTAPALDLPDVEDLPPPAAADLPPPELPDTPAAEVPEVPDVPQAPVEATPSQAAPAEAPSAAEATPADAEAASGAPAETPAAGLEEISNLDLSLSPEPAAQLDAESQQRVDDLLSEGQKAFDGGSFQDAIDAWSRIFLIDIDHAEANRRIEQARKLKAEADRKVEETFHQGLTQLEAGDREAAAATLRQVLEQHPNHLAAREYLDKIESGEEIRLERPAPPAREAPADEDLPSLDDLDAEDGAPGKPKPERGTKAVGERMVTVKRGFDTRTKIFVAIGAVALLLVAGAGWFLHSNWDSYFPNSSEQTEGAAPAAETDPIQRAQALHEEGKTPMAVAQLRRLPPNHPQYAEAQALVAQWETPGSEEAAEGPPPEQAARHQALLARAREAFEANEFLLTTELLTQAAAITPLKASEVVLLAEADGKLQDLQELITYVREGEWEFGLRELWLKHEEDPGNRDVTRLLVNSYYNLGVRDLQRGDPAAAAAKFGEAATLASADAEVQRLAAFTRTYSGRAPDLLFRIFVKYLKFR